MVKEPEGIEIVDISTSSPFITARKLDYFEQKSGYARLKIEVTVKAGLPVGRVNETVTVRSNLEKSPTATLRVSGTVAGNVEVNPKHLRFEFTETEPSRQGLVKKAFIKNNNEAAPLQIFSVRNPDGHLDLEFRPITEGQKYELKATLKYEARAKGTNLGGRIVIITNNPTQGEVIVRYGVIYENATKGQQDKPAGPRRK